MEGDADNADNADNDDGGNVESPVNGNGGGGLAGRGGGVALIIPAAFKASSISVLVNPLLSKNST